MMDFRSWLRIAFASAVVAGIVAASIVVVFDWLRPARMTIGPVNQTSITVMIDGAVATPGMVTLPPDARLQNAIDAAGGLTEDANLNTVNLAGRVADGEHVTIPETSDPVAVLMASPVAGNPSGLVNINTATVFELDELPGIGPVIAQRIVEFREFYGPFESVDQLDEITGISPEMVEALRPLVTIGG